MGIILFWIHDSSPKRARTYRLIDQTVDLNDEATGIIGGSEPNAPDAWNFSINVAVKRIGLKPSHSRRLNSSAGDGCCT